MKDFKNTTKTVRGAAQMAKAQGSFGKGPVGMPVGKPQTSKKPGC